MEAKDYAEQFDYVFVRFLEDFPKRELAAGDIEFLPRSLAKDLIRRQIAVADETAGNMNSISFHSLAHAGHRIVILKPYR